jgi:hypothetical protein
MALLPTSLSTVASGRQAQVGLALVRRQTLEPQLEALLAAAGGRNAEATARVLRAIGRHIEAGDAEALGGLANYLRLGGDVALLARLVSHHSSREFSAEARIRARRNLRRMVGWDAEAIVGIETLFRLRPRISGERLDNLFEDFEHAQVRGILQTLAFLDPVSRHLQRLLGPLTSDSVSQQRGAMGSLTAAVRLIEANPGRILLFEEPVYERVTGRLVRVQDITMIEIVDGVESIVRTYEVKEISTRRLGRRGRHQFAMDVLADSARMDAAAGAGTDAGAHEPFESFRWMIRRNELQVEAASNVGVTDVSDPRVEVEMRRLVEGMLERGFNDPVLRTLSPERLAAYRAAFSGVPFVEFF